MIRRLLGAIRFVLATVLIGGVARVSGLSAADAAGGVSL